MQLPSTIVCCLALACALLLASCGGAPQAHTATVAAGTQPAPPSNAAEAKTVLAATAARLNDSDHDGIPEGAELYAYADRENFRRWFTFIAETQFYRLSEEWNREQRDCAGLVRFSWREALRRHDRLWFQKMGQGYEGVAPDVRAYELEKGLLGDRLFRTAYGTFKESDLAGETFQQFADARTLKNFNTVFVSRDPRRAEPGDLLFFHQPWVQKFPYHIMIFLGRAQTASEGAADWVVYHTGASPEDGGTVKKVRLAVLAEHPDKRWRPLLNNPNFLGFYRLKILD